MLYIHHHAVYIYIHMAAAICVSGYERADEAQVLFSRRYAGEDGRPSDGRFSLCFSGSIF